MEASNVRQEGKASSTRHSTNHDVTETSMKPLDVTRSMLLQKLYGRSKVVLVEGNILIWFNANEVKAMDLRLVLEKIAKHGPSGRCREDSADDKPPLGQGT